MRGNCIAAGLAQMPVQNASSHVPRQSYTLAARAAPGVDDGIFRPANSCSVPIHPDRLGVSPLFLRDAIREWQTRLPTLGVEAWKSEARRRSPILG